MSEKHVAGFTLGYKWISDIKSIIETKQLKLKICAFFKKNTRDFFSNAFNLQNPYSEVTLTHQTNMYVRTCHTHFSGADDYSSSAVLSFKKSLLDNYHNRKKC